MYHTVDALRRHGAEIPRWFAETSWVGAAGVPVFFAISGVVTYHTSQGEFARSGASSAFFLRRILRIDPIYWICAGLALLAFLSVVASILLHVAVERPVMRWIKKSGLTRRRFLPRDEAVSQSSTQ